MGKDIQYQLIRSRRKTIGIQVKDGMVTVRAPLRTSAQEIEAFVERSRSWIEKHLRLQEEMKKRQEETGMKKLTRQELEALAQEAVRRIPERVGYNAPKGSVTTGHITIQIHCF